jgi:hypothetical protein
VAKLKVDAKNKPLDDVLAGGKNEDNFATFIPGAENFQPYLRLSKAPLRLHATSWRPISPAARRPSSLSVASNRRNWRSILRTTSSTISKAHYLL